ncbi:MAG: SIMPL domain-containing protein [Polyangiaceae bacterium]|nr:SIMPL domain-containing protein [Polyangiaceae bacterium]
MMNRLITCSLALSLAALAGCNHPGSAPPTTTPASPPQVSIHSPDPSGVSVTGRGEAQAAPDVAFFDVGVEVDAPTVGAARTSAAKSAERVIAALKKNGVAAKDIQTASLSIQPRYDHVAGRDKITGYGVTTSVTVKARNLDQIGSLIDDAIAAGGNATRVNGIRFGFDDPSRLRDDARQRAVADARRRAEELARLSGVKLAGPITVEELAQREAMPTTVTLESADVARMPIERGTGSVAVEVRVRWAIQG